jgi:FtsP/CotA-like multicopper oxidase with cupredoxin domain
MALRPPMAAWRLPEQSGAPVARPREVVSLANGDTLDLTAGVVRRTLAGRSYTMFGFNGQYPGPMLRVPQGAQVVVRFHNALPLPSTVHWHGLRLDARFDGVPGLSQPAEPGRASRIELGLPDGGIFWYHRMSARTSSRTSASTATSSSADEADAWGPVHREEFLILDALLVGEDGLVPWGRDQPTHAAMGRFGNLLLVNGEPDWTLQARQGEVVRLFLTNVSNTRTFNLSFGPGARLKVVGSDLGNFVRESWTESIVIGPAERYVVEVRFEAPGSVAMLNAVQGQDHLNGRFFPVVDTLGVVAVKLERAEPDLAQSFGALRTDRFVADETVELLHARNQAAAGSGVSSSGPSGWGCPS